MRFILIPILQIEGENVIPACQYRHHKGKEGRIHKKGREAFMVGNQKTVHHHMTPYHKKHVSQKDGSYDKQHVDDAFLHIPE